MYWCSWVKVRVMAASVVGKERGKMPNTIDKND
jgi:hypothetical protein